MANYIEEKGRRMEVQPGWIDELSLYTVQCDCCLRWLKPQEDSLWPNEDGEGLCFK